MELSSPGEENYDCSKAMESVASNQADQQSIPIVFVDSSNLNTKNHEERFSVVNFNNEINPLELKAVDTIKTENVIKEEPLQDFASLKSVEIYETATVQLRYQCDICLKICSNRKALHEHKYTHNNVNRGNITQQCEYEGDSSEKECFQYDVCSNEYSIYSKLQRHKRTHDEKLLVCQYCPKKFNDPNLLKYHEGNHTGDKPYMCVYCSKSFANPSAFCCHRKKCKLKHESVDSTEPRTTHVNYSVYKCRFCSKEYPDKVSLVIHVRVHTGERPYECPSCSKTFANPSSFCRHKRRCQSNGGSVDDTAPRNIHVDDATEATQIHEVTQFTENGGKLLEKNGQPLRISSKEDSNEILPKEPSTIHGLANKCRFCPKTFILKQFLVVHERIHTGEKPYQCPLCSAKFSCPSSFCRHKKRCRFNHSRAQRTITRKIRVDEVERIPAAARSAKSEDALPEKNDRPLDVYIEENSKDIPLPPIEMVVYNVYKCRFCPKKYATKQQVVIHERIHTGEKPYQCPICSTKFSNPSSFCRHKKRCKLLTQIVDQMFPPDSMSSNGDCGSEDRPLFNSGENNSKNKHNHSIEAIKTENSQLDEINSTEADFESQLQPFELKDEPINICDEDATMNESLEIENEQDIPTHIECEASLENVPNSRILQQPDSKLFPCQYCSNVLKRKGILETHERSHTGERPFKCLLCSETFGNSGSFFRHKKRCQLLTRILDQTCPSGAKSSNAESDRGLEDTGLLFYSGECSSKNKNSHSVEANKTENSQLDKIHSTEGNFESELQLNVVKIEPIEIYAKETSMNVGESMEKPSLPFKSIPGDSSGKNDIVTNDIREVNQGTSNSIHDDEYDFETFLENFCCFDDDNDFHQVNGHPLIVPNGTNGNIEAHIVGVKCRAIEVKDPNKMFKCDFCHAEFAEKPKLNRHVQSDHPYSKPFLCKFCPKTYKTRQNLKIHEIIHTGERTFECCICRDTFSQNSALWRHRKTCQRRRQRHI
ncbi:zinc finger protein 271-like [Sitodiplosis mosellana]|uniref:zinc finger protein 271-like n=1 Tax=Sitodiplosis mosellana TaxID=263140 RepID=UPI00244510DE|nr:zinc finger protein 271-like [Sitodiplosis mosellana]XP_055306388.1 zinc finger protein 271-like [Sitodiplosis mosellana]